MGEAFIFFGGVYTVALIVFHLLFRRIFKWPESLASLNYVNRATMQVMNISLTFIFVMFAFISFAYTAELLNTPLGRTMLALISALWLFRAALQLVFYGWQHKASAAFTIYFLLGMFLYGAPVIM